ncbi:MAG TPA: helix-turn-helix domain-containing protein [Acholeplasmataceae bacterium]|nr:helix-turn-helix domain-containing protein [Acholeplasmataceae bacterium]
MIGFGTYLNDYLKYEGISQSDFAFRLGITPKHLNEIINGKTNISNSLMLSIAKFTGIDLNFIARIENRRRLEEDLKNKFHNDEELKKYLEQFKPLEAQKRGWLMFKDINNPYQVADDILSYLKYINLDVVKKAKEIILFKENSNKIELLALWIARCDKLAEKQEVKEYNKVYIKEIIDYINNYCYEYSKFDFDDIKKVLNNYGIYFVIENALSSTKVRGAFKIFKSKPAIYLTKYYKRLDGLVFSLFHELGHVKSDYNQGKSKTIIEGNEVQEKRADDFALNAMIPKKDYKLILQNYHDVGKLFEISRQKRIPMCYIVSRLARDKMINYNDKLYLENIVRLN